MSRYRFVFGPFAVRQRFVFGPFAVRFRSVRGPFALRQRSVNGTSGFSEIFLPGPRHALSLLRDRCADGNGILRPQPMKHLEGFSDDFGDDFGIIFGVILAAGIIALKQGRA
jgi:hypothetical protein